MAFNEIEKLDVNNVVDAFLQLTGMLVLEKTKRFSLGFDRCFMMAGKGTGFRKR